MSKYEITIPRNWGTVEDYQSDRNNIASFNVFDENNNNISDAYKFVQIWISNNGMIGFGTELIRLAHNFEEGKEVKIIPSSKENGAQQSMGIFLTPESCELVIKCENFEPIDTYIDETKGETNSN